MHQDYTRMRTNGTGKKPTRERISFTECLSFLRLLTKEGIYESG